MQKKIPISIIVPVYNAMPYLQETIEGILRQSFANFELLLVDDHSTDESLKYLKEIAKQDERVKVFQTEQKSSGAGAARNVGLKKSRGEYLIFLDSDDRVRYNLVEKLYCLVKDGGVDIGMCEYETDKRKFFRIESTECELGDASANIFQIDNANVWNKIFSREIVDRNRICFDEISTCNDVAFTYSAMSEAKCIKVIHEPLVIYRVKSKTELKKIRGEKLENIITAFASLKKFLVEKESYGKLKSSFVRRMWVSYLREARYSNFWHIKKTLRELVWLTIKTNYLRREK